MGATQSTNRECVLETPRGSLKGIQFSDKKSGKPIYRRFTKVPYAQPPVGSLRWRRPQPLPSDFSFNNGSGEPGDYREFGPVSPQPVYNHKKAELDNPNGAPPFDNIQDEDCLYLNIWVPEGVDIPPSGLPVVFFIHGGWLQVGEAMQDHLEDPFDLFANTGTARIYVSPTYRLNLFGFLAGKPLQDVGEDPAPGNYGFWDQRAALEWTAANIEAFGGNPDNISVGGLSAGANSTFFQLHYDTHLPSSKKLIKRIFLWSNAVGIQPNDVVSEASTSQFNELCSHLSIDTKLSSSDKMNALRKVPAADLVSSIYELKFHTFRATTDSSFIPPSFLQSLHDGSFTTLLAANNISILLGEVSDEKLLYRLVNPPQTYSGLETQLLNYYPPTVVAALLKHYHIPPVNDPDAEKWADIYAQIVADCQVHAVIRGLSSTLLNPPAGPDVQALPASSLHRYRIKWRAKSLDEWIDPNVGVCHGACQPMWWCSGWRAGYDAEDKRKTLKFLEQFNQFIAGKEVQWGASGLKQIREMGTDGNTTIVEDDEWDRAFGVWKCMWDAQKEE